MGRRSWLSVTGACVLLLVTSRSRAECTMDTECGGEEVCEDGQCVASAAALPVAAPPVSAAPPAAAAPPAPRAMSPSVTPPADATPAPLPQPTMVRYSPVMMAAGIVMMPLAFGALFVAASDSLHIGSCGDSTKSCDNDGVVDGALFTAVGLVAVGIPLIMIGARKEPAKPKTTAVVAPWATPTGVGIGLRIKM